jgi:hypothetical protein
MEKSDLIHYLIHPNQIPLEIKAKEIVEFCVEKGKERSLSEKFAQALIQLSVLPGASAVQDIHQVFNFILQEKSREYEVQYITNLENNQIVKIF